MTALQTAKTDVFTGIYEIPEAASILRATWTPLEFYPLSSDKLRRWIRKGLAHVGLRDVAADDLPVTFQDLVSLRTITALRAANVSLQRISAAAVYLREITGHSRPFATESLWTGTSDIFASFRHRLVAAGLHGQTAMDIIEEHLIPVHGLDFEGGVVVSWEPVERVLLRPEIQFGAPCIKGTRIPTWSLYNSYMGGDSIDHLTSAYHIAREEVEAAIAWEERLAA